MSCPTYTNVDILQSFLQKCRSNAESIAFVPTLGGLHEGHLSLIRVAAMKTERTVVSIFLNPHQFDKETDLATYPHSFEKDKQLIESLGLNTVIYAPLHKDVYPKDFSTSVHLPNLENKLCGKNRPGHFSSVATIVVKLILQVLPDYAVFGGKDFQQLRIVRQVCKDLNLPTYIIGSPTVRDSNGLALSSRNERLSPEQHLIASALYQHLLELSTIAATGQNLKAPIKDACDQLLKKGFDKIDYLGLFDTDTFDPIPQIDLENNASCGRVFGAGWLGGVRLIDNVGVHLESKEAIREP